jgi:hypothetical protein
MERVATLETLQEIIAEMGETRNNPATGFRIKTETHLWTCDNDRMSRKKTRESRRKTTQWNLGQPLAFPPKKNAGFERLAREVVQEAMSGPFKAKRKKRKKK